MKLPLVLLPCLLVATGCAVVPAHPTVYADPGYGYGYGQPVYVEPAPVYVQPYPIYAPRPYYAPRHRHGWRDRHHRDGRGGRHDHRSSAPAAPVAAGPQPSSGQVAAQTADPDMRFERRGVPGGRNWVATPQGWGWNPPMPDRP